MSRRVSLTFLIFEKLNSGVDDLIRIRIVTACNEGRDFFF